MIKKKLYYIFILLIIIFTAIISVYIFRQVLEVSAIINKIKISKNYILNLENDEGFVPILCPGSAIKYSMKYNIDFKSFFPLGGIPDGKRKIKNNTDNKEIMYLDKFGFRNTNEVWKTNNIDTLILGDSVAFSSNISDQQLFSNIMNKNAGSVVNLSCGGNGLLNSFALLEDILKNYSVNNILFFINMDNDLTKDIEREWQSGVYKKYVENEDFKSIFKNKEIYKSEVKTFMIDVLNFEINNYKNKIKFRTLFSFNKFKSFINTLCDNILLNFKKDALLTENISLLDMNAETAIFTKNMEYFRLFLSNINRISKFYKKNITFVIIPSKYRLNAPDMNTARSPIKYNITRNKVLTNIIAKSYDVKLIDNKYRISELDYGSYIIDLTNIIMEENKKNIIFNGHFNTSGQIFLAKYLLSKMKTEDFNLIRNILLYNSINIVNSDTHTSYMNNNKVIILEDSQYIDWLHSVKNYFKNNLYDEFLLAPIFSYSFLFDKCSSILDILNTFKESINDKRLVLLYTGVCELKDKNIVDIKNSILKIEKSLFLNVEDIAPDLSLAIMNQLGTLNEIK